MSLSVREGVESTFHYHLGEGTRALCGAWVMPTSIPLSAWGTVTHLRERWCEKCAKADAARAALAAHKSGGEK